MIIYDDNNDEDGDDGDRKDGDDDGDEEDDREEKERLRKRLLQARDLKLMRIVVVVGRRRRRRCRPSAVDSWNLLGIGKQASEWASERAASRRHQEKIQHEDADDDGCRLAGWMADLLV